jgi:hypothetical protein
MRAADALQLARESGVSVVLAGSDLVLDAEREPTPEVLEQLKRHKAEIVSLLASEHEDEWTANDWRVYFDERAAFAEFEGKKPRQQADNIAFECCVAEWLRQHPAPSDPSRCAWCHRHDSAGHTIVPFGTDSHGHTWLHHECWNDWYASRKAVAAAALVSMGLVPPVAVLTA